MITKLVTAWPTLRKLMYAALAVGLSVAFTYGKVDAAQQASILESATQLFAIIGFVIAVFYTPKGGKTIGDGTDTPVEYHVENIDEALARAKQLEALTYRGGPTPSVTLPLPTPANVVEAVTQINAALEPTVAELRARAEASLRAR